uniref:Sex-determining protein fem-1 n=1 Tax=Globodera rostochiensis TaxID=31243 RepID=A0A914IBR1_GLORO
MVFKLTGSGDVERLGSLLETLSAEQLKYLLSAKEPQVNGTSALIIAARNGYTKVVDLLLKMGADPHETGTVTFDGELITRVPPLWASAAAGHLEVCKLLVVSGVNVNQTTNTNSTPLRGACYDGNLDIVKFLVENGADIEIPNRHGHTALMIASYREKVSVVRYLLSVGAQTDRTSTKGNTVLHDAAEAGNDEILRILLEAGTKIQPDDYNVTPLLSAALAGHSHLMPLLMKSANCKQKHDAWKLLGATTVDKWLDMGAAITYWKKAFSPDIRVDCSQFVKELDAVRTKVYGGFREVESLEDVLGLFGDPDAIRMQALIIRERILGDSHPDTHTWDRTWEMWSYILQLEQFYHHPMMIDEMMQPGRRQMNRNHMPSIEQVLVILERAVYEAERYLFSDEESLSEHMWTFEDRNIRSDLESLLGMCLQFVHLVSRVNLMGHWLQFFSGSLRKTAPTEKPSYIITNNNDRFCARAFIGKALDQVPKIDLDGLRPNCAHLKCIVRRLLTVSRKLGIKLLHIACEEKEMNREDLDIVPRIPSIFVVEKLLFAGANPCEVDECGNTPLHILLLTSSIDRHAIVKALLDMGAPLFARNRHNDTCFDLIRRKPGILRTLRIGRYLSLKQIAANVVNRNGINRIK